MKYHENLFNGSQVAIFKHGEITGKFLQLFTVDTPNGKHKFKFE
jgi:hypothetical protein